MPTWRWKSWSLCLNTLASGLLCKWIELTVRQNGKQWHWFLEGCLTEELVVCWEKLSVPELIQVLLDFKSLNTGKSLRTSPWLDLIQEWQSWWEGQRRLTFPWDITTRSSLTASGSALLSYILLSGLWCQPSFSTWPTNVFLQLRMLY